MTTSQPLWLVLGLVVGIAVPLASFSAGLRSTEPLWLWRRPRLLAKSLLVVLVLVPLVCIALMELLAADDAWLRGGVVIAILSVGLGPPQLMKRARSPREVACYQIGFNVVLMSVAVFYLPLSVAVHGVVFHHELSLSWLAVAKVVLLQALVPFWLGLALAYRRPRLAARIERQAPRVVIAAMALVGLLALILTWRSLVDLGARAWLVCLAVSMLAVAIGHVLGGPARETRMVLADFSVMRFPALALLLVSIVPRGERLIPIVLAYVISSILVDGVYRAATRRRAAEPVPAEP